MTCEHVKQLYQLCQQNNLKLTSGDLIRIVCPQCGVADVCPSVYSAEYDATHQDEQDADEPTVEHRPDQK
ncbi:MAG: hypothetical protein KF708_12995 [Pirellulales bacterium]|nr:hypothetical protein [Pirellulales bacterium]